MNAVGFAKSNSLERRLRKQLQAMHAHLKPEQPFEVSRVLFYPAPYSSEYGKFSLFIHRFKSIKHSAQRHEKKGTLCV